MGCEGACFTCKGSRCERKVGITCLKGRAHTHLSRSLHRSHKPDCSPLDIQAHHTCRTQAGEYRYTANHTPAEMSFSSPPSLAGEFLRASKGYWYIHTEMRAQQGVAQRYKVPRYLSCLYGKLSLGFCCLAEIDLQVWLCRGILTNWWCATKCSSFRCLVSEAGNEHPRKDAYRPS